MAYRQNFLWLVAIGVGCVAGVAYAKEAPFYIELGTAVTKEDAAQDWKELKDKYPKQLRNLAFAARPLAVEGESTMFRIQGGPVKNKDFAFRICAEMLANDDECFVVQTEVEKAVGALPSKRRTIDVSRPPVTASLSSALLPWGAAAQEMISSKNVQAAPAITETVLEGEATATEGTVAVSEAIRVPLSEQASPAATSPIMQGDVGAQNNVESVRIGYFADEQSAIDFWRALREKMPEASESWHVRTHKPLVKDRPALRVMLSVESTTEITAAAAQQVCTFATSYGRSLTCIPKQTEKNMDASGKPTRSYRSINATGMSREEALSMQNPQQLKNEEKSRYADRRKEQPDTKAHWAQLGSAGSRRGARELWDQIQAKHAGLFEGYEPFVNTPVGEQDALHSSFRLRTGPFKGEKATEQFCRKLQAQKVSCLAVEDY